MKKVDGYLSRKAQAVWPEGIVYKFDDGRFFIEQQEGVMLELGSNFGEAKESLVRLIHATIARRKRT